MRTKKVMAIAVFTLLHVMIGCRKQQERVTVVGSKGVMYAAEGDKLVWTKLSPKIPDFRVRFTDGSPCGNTDHVDVKGNAPGYCNVALPKGAAGSYRSVNYEIDFYIPPSVLPDPVVPCNMCGSLDAAQPTQTSFVVTTTTGTPSKVPGAISCVTSDKTNTTVVTPITVSLAGGSVPWTGSGDNDWTIDTFSLNGSPNSPCHDDPVTFYSPCYLTNVTPFGTPPVTLHYTFRVTAPSCSPNSANGDLYINP